MNKVKLRIFKGIEFIHLSDLPDEQLKSFKSWLPSESIINIQMNNKVHKDCVQYSEYERWFENYFQKEQHQKASNPSGRGSNANNYALE